MRSLAISNWHLSAKALNVATLVGAAVGFALYTWTAVGVDPFVALVAFRVAVSGPLLSPASSRRIALFGAAGTAFCVGYGYGRLSQ